MTFCKLGLELVLYYQSNKYKNNFYILNNNGKFAKLEGDNIKMRVKKKNETRQG